MKMIRWKIKTWIKIPKKKKEVNQSLINTEMAVEPFVNMNVQNKGFYFF